MADKRRYTLYTPCLFSIDLTTCAQISIIITYLTSINIYCSMASIWILGRKTFFTPISSSDNNTLLFLLLHCSLARMSNLEPALHLLTGKEPAHSPEHWYESSTNTLLA